MALCFTCSCTDFTVVLSHIKYIPKQIIYTIQSQISITFYLIMNYFIYIYVRLAHLDTMISSDLLESTSCQASPACIYCDTVSCSARCIFPSKKTRFLRLMVVTQNPVASPTPTPTGPWPRRVPDPDNAAKAQQIWSGLQNFESD